MQYFHWYITSQDNLWNKVRENARNLSESGITALWLPPAYKGTGGANDVGYGIYDLYDLGEFDQKNSVRTKYGTRQEYLEAISALHSHGVEAYADAVLNQKMGGDASEVTKAVPFFRDDRLNACSGEKDVRVYTSFTFPGRKGVHSDFQWHWWHFDAVDYDDFNPGDGGKIFLLQGKKFDDYVAQEHGNFAYLMGCDLDFQHEEVRKELTAWGKWYLDTTGVDGFRLDAIKHISSWFFPEWLDTMRKHAGRELFVVGEYWVPDIKALHWYIDAVGARMSVFDVPLHFNFHYASKQGGNFDMRRILDGTLMKERPTHAVTFVDNHDSQPLQALESVVEPWFKPLAYAFILLRAEGYPCVFYPDYYGAEYEDTGKDGGRYRIIMPSHKFLLDIFLKARRLYAYGPQYDYLDHYNCIGWTRLGDENHPKSLAVLMSDGPPGSKWMEVGKPGAGFTDLTGHVKEPVRANSDGWAEFFCNGGSVSVWLQE